MSFTVNYRTSNDDFKEIHLMLLDEARSEDDARRIARERATENGYVAQIESIHRFTCNPDYDKGEISGYHRVHNVLDDKAKLTIKALSPLCPSRNEGGEVIGEVQYIELSVDDYCSELEFRQLVHQLFYYPNQINSQYDCSGKSFVALSDTYTKHNPIDDKWEAVVVLHWMCDI